MWRTVVAGMWAHKRRTLGTGTAVVLGVAFLAGTLVLGDTMRAGFGDLFAEANAGVDAKVRSADVVEAGGVRDGGTVDGSLVETVAGVEGVAVAAPFVEQSGQLVAADGEVVGGEGPPTLAGNWVADEGLNPYRLVAGRAPGSAREVVIDEPSADAAELGVGDRAVVRVPDPVEVTVVGLVQLGSRDGMAGATFVGFTTAAAQDVLMPDAGSLTGVVVAAEDGVSQEQLVDRLQPVLPAGVEAVSGEALTAEEEADIEADLLGFLETFLLVFAGIALVVATFSIYNTFSILVAQRTRESALLRSFGASRRQVLAGVFGEAAAVGLLASAVGVLAGLGLATALMAWMESMGFDMPSSDLVVGTGSIVAAVVVGMLATRVASMAPAVRASRVAPIAALREVAVDGRSGSRWRVVGGTATAASGALVVLAGAAVAGDLLVTSAGALLLIVGMVLFGPVVARPGSAVLGAPLARLRGISGRLARANAMRNPTRTSGTAAALMVGVAVVGMFTIVAASLKTYVGDTVEGAFAGDLVVSSDGFSGVGLSPDLVATVADLPEVDTASPMGLAPLRVDDRETLANAVDGPSLDPMLDIGVVRGDLADLDGDAVALLDEHAEEHGYEVGSTVDVDLPGGVSRPFTVVATYTEPDLVGDVLVPGETWARHATQPQDDMLLVGLADGVSTGDGQARIQALTERYGGIRVLDSEEFVADTAGDVDEMLTVVYVLLALAIVIALMGIANTLSLSIHERTRELGLLRAVGQSRRQLRAMVRGESLIVALFGTVGGLGLAGFLGWALLRSLSEEEGVTVPFTLPAGQMAGVLLLGGVVGLVAAVRPARRAGRLDVLEAIAAE